MAKTSKTVRKDRLSKDQRSYCMSQVKGKNTSLEVIVRSELFKRGLRFRKHVRKLPGSPDIVFVSSKTAVFLDGDFWHGYRFGAWSHKLKPYWKEKISRNIRRDRANRRKLRSMGWAVLRIWEHEVKDDLANVVRDISKVANSRKSRQI